MASVDIVPDMSSQESTIDSMCDSTWKSQKALEIKRQLETLLFNTGSLNFSNKTRRQIKKLFNEQINLTDNMFKGFHTNGELIGSLGNDEKEIKLLYNVLKKTPSISFEKASSTIKKWIHDAKMNTIREDCLDCLEDSLEDNVEDNVEDNHREIYPSKKHKLIVGAYMKYMEEVKNKKVVVKTRGIDLVSKCWEYWKSTETDPVIEEQINKTCDELKTFLSSSFDEKFTFDEFANSLVLVLDISGSMGGVPLTTGLFYMLVLVKIFQIKTLHYFESDIEVRTICPSTPSNLELIKQIYVKERGSTELNSVFKHLNKVKTNNKNIVIITDGDCDPKCYDYVKGISNNPFHEVTRLDKEQSKYPFIENCHYVVVNVKQTEMNFPYLGVDPMVCYLTGNNPKTINGFIKALCESSKSGTVITPDLVLKYTLTLDELDFSEPVPAFTKVMTDVKIAELFDIFQKNLPPKKIV